MRETLHPWTSLPIKSVLVGIHVCCLLRDRRRADLFLSYKVETEAKLRVRLWKAPPKIRLPSTTNTIPGSYRAYNLIQGGSIQTAG